MASIDALNPAAGGDGGVMVKKKPRNNSRKVLKPKENVISQENTVSPRINGKEKPVDFEKELREMQELMTKLKIEKEKTEEILKAKEQELESKDREHEKLQQEIKKLQKLKDFNPTVNLSIGNNVGEKDHGKKKKGGMEHKRPSPAYILWCKDQWNELKKENPNADFKEISNMLGAKWKTISSEEKKPYEEKYKVDKEIYLQLVNKEKRESEALKLLEEEQRQKTAMELLEQYVQFKKEADRDKKKTKKAKDPLKPKQPLSAFLIFSNERRAALLDDGKSVTEAAKITGEEWKNLEQGNRARFEEMAKKNREKYEKEMEVYKQMKEEEALNIMKEEEEQMKIQKHEAMQLLKRKEKTDNIFKKNKERRQKKRQVADANKPKRPASAFILFSKEARVNIVQERPGVTNSTLNALISIKWKELGQEERQMWNSKAAEAMEAYKKELEEYNKTMAGKEPAQPQE